MLHTTEDELEENEKLIGPKPRAKKKRTLVKNSSMVQPSTVCEEQSLSNINDDIMDEFSPQTATMIEPAILDPQRTRAKKPSHTVGHSAAGAKSGL